MLIHLTDDAPAYRQIYRGIRQAILDGRLGPGIRLPASRRLASDLGVARITVVQAYDQLTAEGYLDARRGAGTWVATDLRGLLDRRAPPPGPSTPHLSAYAARAVTAAPATPAGRARQPLRRDFRYGEPEVTGELLADWRRALRRAAQGPPTGYPDPQGEPQLRDCLAAYLRDHRGVLADPGQIMVVAGTQQALELIGRCVLDPGDRVVIEEPHYQGARHALRALGAELVPVAVDADGLRTDTLPEGQDTDSPGLACVTPSHQFPLGSVLPVPRRLALLDWARRHGAFVIEDDYDSEYRHEGPPLQSLHSLDRTDRVLYVGTLSKVLFPALRLGYVVLPPSWVEPMRQVKWLADRGSSPLEQLALAELFRTGAFRRHTESTGRRLSYRRRVLVAALERHFGESIEMLGTRSGMHLTVRWPSRGRRETGPLLAKAARRGVGLYPTAPYYDGAPPAHLELLMGYAALSPASIRAGVCHLRRSLEAANGRR